MTSEKDLQDAWLKLQNEKASLYEHEAMAVASGVALAPNHYARMSDVLRALHALGEARKIRNLIAKCEAIGDIKTED